MNRLFLSIAALVGAAMVGTAGIESEEIAHAQREYSINESTVTSQGSIIRIAFEEFADTPMVATPEDLTVFVEYPTNGGSGSSSVTLACEFVDEVVDLINGHHIFTCHLDGDIHAGDGEAVPNEGTAVRIYAEAGWAQGGGDSSEEVDDTGNENLLMNGSEVPYEKPTHHWDSRPFQVQSGEFIVDSIVTHRYGIYKVEHRVFGDTGAWTQAILVHKPGPTPESIWIPVWRSTLDAAVLTADDWEGQVEVRVTPARGDSESVLTSAVFDPDLGHHEWSHADFRHPHETNLPVIMNPEGTFSDDLTIVYAAVDREAGGGSEAALTEEDARTTPFPTIEAAKLAIRDYRDGEELGENVTAGIIVCEEGTHFLGTEPQDHWNEGSSAYVPNEGFLTIRAANGADPEAVIITNCAFVVRIPSGKSPDDFGFIRITNPGQGNTVKLEIRPNSGVSIDEFPFGSGQGQYATVTALVAAVNAAGYEAVEVLEGMDTVQLKFRTWQFDDQDANEVTHFRFFEINRSPHGVNVRRLTLQNLTTHTTQILSATGSSKRALLLDWTRHIAHAQGEQASEMVARSNKFHHGIWVYSASFENLNVAGNGWTYARDCSFVRCADAFRKCIAAVNPHHDDSGVITGQDTHPDLFQWFMAQTAAPAPPEDDPEDVAAVAETRIFNILLLNMDASDPGVDAQPFFFTAGDEGTYQRVAIINEQWHEVNREQAFYGNYEGLNLWHLSALQGGSRKLVLRGFNTTISRYENLSIRNTACEALHITARSEGATGTQGDTPSFWSTLNEVHIRSTLEDATGTLTVTDYPDATTGEALTALFTDPSNGDLSPNEAREDQPHLFDRPSEVPLLWPYDALGVERIATARAPSAPSSGSASPRLPTSMSNWGRPSAAVCPTSSAPTIRISRCDRSPDSSPPSHSSCGSSSE